MKIKLGVKNRVTIPKELCEQLGWDAGDDIEVCIQENNIVFTKCCNNNKSKPSKDIKSPGCSVCDTNTQIKSNLEDVGKYSVQVFSDCGLVVKTKRRYINNFCDKCKGELIKHNKELDCKYKSNNLETQNNNDKVHNKTSIKNNKKVTNVVQDINDNIDKLKTKINKDIDVISSSTTFKSSTTIQPIKYAYGFKCTNCCKTVKSGFIINDKELYCKECTLKDFKDYFIKYKKGECK